MIFHYKWYKDTPDKVRNKEYRQKYYNNPIIKSRCMYQRLLREFGITEEQYKKLIKDQNNLCAICGKSEKEVSNRNKNLSVDHCHKTHKVRGLLCTNCNRAIGLLGDDIGILQKAINYLTKFKNESTNKKKPKSVITD
jgi:hypothetical protein